VPIKTLDIQFPAAGVVRRWGLTTAYDSQKAYPTPWSVNVRLEDVLTKRLRGGSFTGRAAVAKASPIMYRDRVLTKSGRAVLASRQGAAADFTFSADVSDTMRPIVFQCALADEQGPTVVALVPHKDAYLLCFSSSAVWVLAGDPATGSMRRISDQVGIIGASAWCVAHDTVYFLSSRGLYSVGADGSGMKAVSEDRLPEDLIGVTDATCVLDYYHADRGVYITTTGQDWFYDTERDGFWPYTVASTDSHVLLGPIQLGQANSYGRIENLHGTTAAGSADVTWRIVPGDTAEAAAVNGKAAITADLAGTSYTEYIHAEGTWSAGRSHMAYPRTRAVWCCLWLRSEGTWAYESVAMTAMLSGGWR
jgi:hypothetical protein